MLKCRMQDCHVQAWDAVGKYMSANLKVFSGKVETADSTIMPAMNAWLSEAVGDIAEIRDSNDFAIVGWLCLPTAGVIGAQKWDLFVTMICNLLSQHRRNGVVLIVHSNRAAQMQRGSPSDRNAACVRFVHCFNLTRNDDMIYYEDLIFIAVLLPTCKNSCSHVVVDKR